MSIFQIVKNQGWKILLLLTVPYLFILLIGNTDWWQVSEFVARTALNRNPSVFTNIDNMDEQVEIITSNTMFDVFAAESQICESATNGSMAQSLSLIASELGDLKTQKMHESIINLNTICTSVVDFQDHLASLDGLSSHQLQISPESIQQLNQTDIDETILALNEINQFLNVLNTSINNLNATITPLLDENIELNFIDPEGTLSLGLQSWIDDEEQISIIMSDIERNRQTLRTLNGAYQFSTFMKTTGTNWFTRSEEFINQNLPLYTKILLIVFGVWIAGLVGSFLDKKFRGREETIPSKEK